MNRNPTDPVYDPMTGEPRWPYVIEMVAVREGASPEERYVAAGHLPAIQEAEDSWSSSIATVLVAVAAAAAFLGAIGYW